MISRLERFVKYKRGHIIRTEIPDTSYVLCGIPTGKIGIIRIDTKGDSRPPFPAKKIFCPTNDSGLCFHIQNTPLAWTTGQVKSLTSPHNFQT